VNRSRFVTIFLIVFVDVFGFGLILPLLPYYAGQFQASNVVIGLLGASYALGSMVGSPILGRLSDRFGRRPLLLVSVFGTLVGYVVLGLAQSLWMLFLGRVIDGLTAGNITVAQSYIADITDEKNRARGLGITGAAFGLGFILGPSLGGLLSHWGYPLVSFAAAGVSAIDLLLVALLLPESLTPERRAELAAQPRQGVSLARLVAAFREPRFGPALTVRAGFWFAFAIFQTTFSLWARNELGVSASTTGLILGYVGLMSVLVQVAFIGPLTRRYAEGRVMVWTLSVAGLGLLLWGFVPGVPLVFVLLTPLTIAVAIQNTISSSLLSKSVERSEIGGAFGLSNSLQSGGNVIAPVLGTSLLSVAGWAPGMAAGVVSLILVPFAYAKFVRREMAEAQPR
jgi:DHA1 family tetracycline resistance protein-like MFS transporter